MFLNELKSRTVFTKDSGSKSASFHMINKSLKVFFFQILNLVSLITDRSRLDNVKLPFSFHF